jgi:proline iminopeptidase
VRYRAIVLLVLLATALGLLWAVALGPRENDGTRIESRSPALRQAADVFDKLQENVWYLPTADGKAYLYVTSLGNGPEVVVLHGGPGNDFNYLVDAVRPESDDYRFVLYDQRGSLLSPVPEREIKELTATTMVEDLDSLRIALGKQKLILLGHSWGTILALLYYQAHPEHVAGLVLTGSGPPQIPLGESFANFLGPMRSRQRAMRERSEVKEVLDAEGLGSKGPPDHFSAEQQSWKHRIEGLAAVNVFHVERWRQVQGGGVYYNEAVDDAIGNSLPARWDIEPTLREHPVPITIVQGDHDFFDPSASTWRSLESSRDVQIVVIRDAGHYSWIDNPDAFAQAVRTGLSRIVQKASWHP